MDGARQDDVRQTRADALAALQHVYVPPQSDGVPMRIVAALALVVVLGLAGLIALVLRDSRNDAWQQAIQSSRNVAIALERDIEHTVMVYDLSLQAVITGQAMPGIQSVSPEIRSGVLFDNAASAPYFGPTLLLDAAGNIVADSTSAAPPSANLADASWFRVHRDHQDVGLYISGPARDAADGAWCVMFSRRVNHPNGSFAGVAAGSLRLDYFQALFSRIDMGPGGVVGLISIDGRLLYRSPPAGADLVNEPGPGALMDRFAVARSGIFDGVARLDGVHRVYVYSQIGELPLIVSVGRSYDAVFAQWWHKALLIGASTALLAVVTSGLAVALWYELRRRARVERELATANAELSLLATSDSLTGLPNRRSFDAMLRREWRRAARQATPIGLLLLDVDNFKVFNDRYGQGKGDECLQAIARAVLGAIRRPGDLAARHSGQRFAIILPATDLAGSAHIAAMIHAAVAGLAIPHSGSLRGTVGVSIGIADVVPAPGSVPTEFLTDADAALHDAKRAGGNRTAIPPAATVTSATVAVT
jgi:diguanylate cyclase (GGDEF)-like protein